MDKKIFTLLGFVGVSFGLVIADISIPTKLLPQTAKIILFLIAVIFDMIGMSSRFYSYLFAPAIKQHRRNLVISDQDAYWLATSGDAVLRKEGEMFTATVYIKIPLYRSATEMNEDEKLDFTRQMSRLLAVSDNPTRFTAQLHIMNKDSYIKVLRENISQDEDAEMKLVSSSAPPNKIERIRGRLAMWRRMLENVAGTNSLELISYASVSANGDKEYEATAIAHQRAREIMSGIAAVFGITPSIITGDDILRFVEPEYLLPYSTVSEQMSKTLREQVA
jgi:hypothetical protein